jgi:hypothetical protein
MEESMDNEELIGMLIHARTALKTENSKEALDTVRKILALVDPGQEIEMKMRARSRGQDDPRAG